MPQQRPRRRLNNRIGGIDPSDFFQRTPEEVTPVPGSDQVYVPGSARLTAAEWEQSPEWLTGNLYERYSVAIVQSIRNEFHTRRIFYDASLDLVTEVNYEDRTIQLRAICRNFFKEPLSACNTVPFQLIEDKDTFRLRAVAQILVDGLEKAVHNYLEWDISKHEEKPKPDDIRMIRL
jgi:hypothetical protein